LTTEISNSHKLSLATFVSETKPLKSKISAG
jgi:hypothetical protein